jgi:2-(1,2-epoxy-1,2-dihydrophenyl)acetyl-CoA isomerase
MSLVLKETRQGVAMVTLNRPEKVNSINREMALLLQQALKECADDKSIRAIYITGSGKGFCAGQDLSEAISASAGDMEKILPEQLNPIVTAIRNIEKPVIAAVNGVAAGAGANVALCCDIVVACSTATFIQAFTKLGLIPDTGGTYILPRLIGWQKATSLMMLAETVSAHDAERMGMIYKVFDDAMFADESLKIAYALAQMPTRALALTKQALQRSPNNTFEGQLTSEQQLQAAACNTKDFSEGVKAFVEKRKPAFSGE